MSKINVQKTFLVYFSNEILVYFQRRQRGSQSADSCWVGKAGKVGKVESGVAGEEVFVIFFKDFCKAKQKANSWRRGPKEVTSPSPKVAFW